MEYIKVNKINFDATSLINIHSTSFQSHRANFIKALNECKNNKEVEKVLCASLNIMYEKAKHIDETTW